MFVDLDWPLNASSLLSASAELLVYQLRTEIYFKADVIRRMVLHITHFSVFCYLQDGPLYNPHGYTQDHPAYNSCLKIYFCTRLIKISIVYAKLIHAMAMRFCTGVRTV